MKNITYSFLFILSLNSGIAQETSVLILKETFSPDNGYGFVVCEGSQQGLDENSLTKFFSQNSERFPDDLAKKEFRESIERKPNINMIRAISPRQEDDMFPPEKYESQCLRRMYDYFSETVDGELCKENERNSVVFKIETTLKVKGIKIKSFGGKSFSCSKAMTQNENYPFF